MPGFLEKLCPCVFPSKEPDHDVPSWDASQVESISTALSKIHFETRQSPNIFLFIGESGSGKTTSLLNFVSGLDPEDHTHTSNSKDFGVWTKTEKGNTTYAIEVPGLLGNNSEESSAKIVLALSNYLKNISPRSLPAIVFITADLSNNLIEGSHPTFSKTLKLIRQCKSRLTDDSCFNVVLLLTKSDEAQPDLYSSNFTAYQNAFKQVFPNADNIFSVVLKNGSPANPQFPHLITALQSNFLTKVHSVKYGRVSCLNGADNPFENSEYGILEVSSLISTGQSETIAKIIKALADENKQMVSDVAISNPMERLEHSVVMKKVANVSICNKRIDNVNITKGAYTFVLPSSAIMLVGKVFVKARDCRVGDLVVGDEMKLGVITNIIPFDLSNAHIGNSNIGMLCVIDDASSHSSVRQKFYDTTFSDLRSRVVSNNSMNWPSDEYCLYIEVNMGRGTFISDMYVCKSSNTSNRLLPNKTLSLSD